MVLFLWLGLRNIWFLMGWFKMVFLLMGIGLKWIWFWSVCGSWKFFWVLLLLTNLIKFMVEFLVMLWLWNIGLVRVWSLFLVVSFVILFLGLSFRCWRGIIVVCFVVGCVRLYWIFLVILFLKNNLSWIWLLLLRFLRRMSGFIFWFMIGCFVLILKILVWRSDGIGLVSILVVGSLFLLVSIGSCMVMIMMVMFGIDGFLLLLINWGVG